MIKIALIAPPNQLEWCRYSSGVQMALARLVLADRNYANFFRTCARNGDLVIMDNGAAEAGTLSIEELLPAAEMCGATEIVVPDVINDAKATLALARESIPKCPVNARLMIVPQGNTFSEWIDCLDKMLEIEDDDRIVSVGISKYHVTPRKVVLKHLADEGYTKLPLMWHLLGIQTLPIELTDLRQYKFVRSIDTAAPIAFGLKGQHIAYPKHIGLDWAAPEPDDRIKELILRNISNFKWLAV